MHTMKQEKTGKKRFYRQLSVLTALVLGCGMVSEVYADDATANNMVLQARLQYDTNSLSPQERAFELFYDAYGQAESAALKKSIENELCTIYQNYTASVTNNAAPFADVPIPTREFFYQKLANYKDRRGIRLYGELLLSRNDLNGFDKLLEAANAGDGRACYLVAQAYAYARYGCVQNTYLASLWLTAAVSAGYAPALEMQAAVLWDGDAGWNSARNQETAVVYLQRAIQAYKQFTFVNAQQQALFEEYTTSLQHILQEMLNYKGCATDRIIQGFYPSFLALRLSSYNEGDGGLRRRMYYIYEYMSRYPGTFHTGVFKEISLENVPIFISYSADCYGVMCPSYMSDSVNVNIQVHAENMADVYDLKSRWLRETRINSTIAHELAHALMFTRYQYVFSDKYAYNHYVLEGHATNTAYAFLNVVYYGHGLFTERFASEYCSTTYASYFRWYRANCMKTTTLTDWSVIESHERAASNGYRAYCDKNVVCGKEGSFYAPIYFNRGFYGWL